MCATASPTVETNLTIKPAPRRSIHPFRGIVLATRMTVLNSHEKE